MAGAGLLAGIAETGGHLNLTTWIVVMPRRRIEKWRFTMPGNQC